MIPTTAGEVQKACHARLVRGAPGRTVAAVGLSLCALAVVLYGLTRGNWINGFLVGIALATKPPEKKG